MFTEGQGSPTAHGCLQAGSGSASQCPISCLCTLSAFFSPFLCLSHIDPRCLQLPWKPCDRQTDCAFSLHVTVSHLGLWYMAWSQTEVAVLPHEPGHLASCLPDPPSGSQRLIFPSLRCECALSSRTKTFQPPSHPFSPASVHFYGNYGVWGAPSVCWISLYHFTFMSFLNVHDNVDLVKKGEKWGDGPLL